MVNRSTLWNVGMALSLVALFSGAASAQDRPFVFSVTTPPPPDDHGSSFRLDYDVGGGERTFQGDRGNQPESQLSLYATRGRFTLVGRVNMVSTGATYESEQSGEVLVSMRQPATTGVSLAAGGGVLRELSGTNVLLARVVGGHESESWRLHANLLLQKPLAAGRDAVDLISTVGWARRVTRAVALGVEAVAEDVEGFWEIAEAEGGARILVGPSLHVAPAGRKWQVAASGGPTFHPDDTGLLSDASRELPPTTRRYGYAVKAVFAYQLR
jgi:hypothetical protein